MGDGIEENKDIFFCLLQIYNCFKLQIIDQRWCTCNSVRRQAQVRDQEIAIVIWLKAKCAFSHLNNISCHNVLFGQFHADTILTFTIVDACTILPFTTFINCKFHLSTCRKCYVQFERYKHMLIYEFKCHFFMNESLTIHMVDYCRSSVAVLLSKLIWWRWQRRVMLGVWLLFSLFLIYFCIVFVQPFSFLNINFV